MKAPKFPLSVKRNVFTDPELCSDDFKEVTSWNVFWRTKPQVLNWGPDFVGLPGK